MPGGGIPSAVCGAEVGRGGGEGGGRGGGEEGEEVRGGEGEIVCCCMVGKIGGQVWVEVGEDVCLEEEFHRLCVEQR